MSTESVMQSNHLILCHPLFLLPSIFPSIRLFSNKLDLLIRWPKYWSFSLCSNEHTRLLSFRIDWFHLLAVKWTLKSLLQYYNLKHQFLNAQASLWQYRYRYRYRYRYIDIGRYISHLLYPFLFRYTPILFLCVG